MITADNKSSLDQLLRSSQHLLAEGSPSGRRLDAAFSGCDAPDLAGSAKLLEILLENSPVGVCMSDAELKIVLYNRRLLELLELPDDIFASQTATLEDLFWFNTRRGEYGPGDDHKIVSRRVTLAKKGLAHVYERERPNGTVLEVRGFPIKGGGFVSIYSDVTEQRRKTRQLEAIVNHFPGGICLFDENLEMVQHNQKLVELLDYPEHLFRDQRPSLRQLFQFNAERGEYGDGDVTELVNERMERLNERSIHEYRRKRPNGKVLEVRGAPVDGGGFMTTYTDVTAECKSQELIAHMAMHDSLTGLANRALLMDRLQGAAARAKRGVQMALHYLDLDKFKPVNDAFGHAVGDELLKQVADRLKHSTRDTDTVARLGGDEFVILQADITRSEDAILLAERILKAMASTFEIEDLDVQIGASIGIALAPDHSASSDDLLRLADSALYRSKAKGRQQFSFALSEETLELIS